MALRESAEQALLRWAKLEVVQKEYAEFSDFLDAGMAHLGFDVSEIQQDIGHFMAHGPQYSMVQAQRGQAKTTIAALYAVWSLIHDPKHRVLILSAGGKQANEISTLIVRIIMTMDELECLRPDASNGDRTSVEAFDVHYSLKGIDKSPSVACIGVTGNMQGKRADLLIPDDIESKKNSLTAPMREGLLELTRDFTSICETGRILYLGTPQTQESVYNSLPGRGYVIRIWPGRYPNLEQAANYGQMLAPYIRRKISLNPALAYGGGMLGDQGQAVDTRLDEHVLQAKELDQGPSYFQLQHMLNTKLMDALRYPLKIADMILMRLGGAHYPMTVTRGFGGSSLKPFNVHGASYTINTAHEVSNDVAPLQGCVMYVDPAGGGKNGDETGYAVTGFLNGNIFLLAAGGIPGGYGIKQMERLAEIALQWQVNKVIVEKNMGYGAFTAVWLPILRKVWKGAVEDDYVTGQKELRIIETLEPVIARGSFIVNEALLQEDIDTTMVHDPAKRSLYSLFHQISKITRDKNCLFHDDRADAVEGATRYWVKMLAQDQDYAIKRMRERELAAQLADPLGKSNYGQPPRRGGSIFNKYLRS